MNILFVVPRVPEPPDTGAKIRTFNLFKQAQAYGHNVTLLPFSGPDKYSIKTVFLALAKGLPLSVAKYRSCEMAEVIVRTVREKKIDVVHFDHVHMGQYIDFIPGVPAVIDEHNVECLILKRLADNTSNPIKKILLEREYRRMAALEVRVCSKASRVLFVSEEDRQNYGKLGGDLRNTEVIPNGVDTEYFNLKIASAAARPRNDTFETRPRNDTLKEGDSLVFTGSMDWVPNSDAVLWFRREILPLIWQKKFAVIFYIVGKNPPESIKKLADDDKRIIVTGSVPDVRPYVERSQVFVVPLRIGGGTRLKILEAMSMGKAVVSTVIGAEGIDCVKEQDIILKDAPQDFAASVLALLDNPEKISSLGESGRRLVCGKYDWKIIAKTLNAAYQEIVGENK